jgi:hypothetical protein
LISRAATGVRQAKKEVCGEGKDNEDDDLKSQLKEDLKEEIKDIADEAVEGVSDHVLI